MLSIWALRKAPPFQRGAFLLLRFGAPRLPREHAPTLSIWNQRPARAISPGSLKCVSNYADECFPPASSQAPLARALFCVVWTLRWARQLPPSRLGRQEEDGETAAPCDSARLRSGASVNELRVIWIGWNCSQSVNRLLEKNTIACAKPKIA